MGTMADDIAAENTRRAEEYNGYANRETWAFNLHWQNDQGLYNETLDAARTTAAQTESDSGLGEFVVDYWRQTIDEMQTLTDRGEAPSWSPLPTTLRMFDREVGSWWRIDYAEVGAAVRESLDNES